MRVLSSGVLCSVLFLGFGSSANAEGGGIHFRGVSATYKSIIRGNVSKASSSSRELLRQVEPQLSVSDGSKASSMTYVKGASDFLIDFNKNHLNRSVSGRHVVWHEIGHVVLFSGIDSNSRHAFALQFKKSAKWEDCFRFKSSDSTVAPDSRNSCLSFDEIFAEQFAFFSIGDRKHRSIYNVPPLISDSSMHRLLKKFFKAGANSLPPASVDPDNGSIPTPDMDEVS